MKVMKERKYIDGIGLFPSVNDLITTIKSINDKINFNSVDIIDKVNYIHRLLISGDEVIKFTRFDRWLPSKFGFKKSNLLTIDFWYRMQLLLLVPND